MSRKFFLPLGLIGLMLAIGWSYSRHSLFRFSEMKIFGAEGEVTKQIQDKLVSYLGRGLYSLSLGNIESEILLDNRIKRVQLTRVWPYTLRISIDLKEPVIRVPFKKGFKVLDREASLVEFVGLSSERLNILPLVEGLYHVETAKPLVDSFRLDEIVNFFAEEQSREGSNFDFLKVSSAKWVPFEGLSLVWGETSLKIFLGKSHFSEAWSRLSAVWPEYLQRQAEIESLDASFQSRVIARTRRELQKSNNSLNLEELVRRGEDNGAPSAR